MAPVLYMMAAPCFANGYRAANDGLPGPADVQS